MTRIARHPAATTAAPGDQVAICVGQTIDENKLLKSRGYTADEVGFRVAAELVQNALHAIGLKSYVIELGLEFDLLILAADAGDVGLVIIAAQADIDRAGPLANCHVVGID